MPFLFLGPQMGDSLSPSTNITSVVLPADPTTLMKSVGSSGNTFEVGAVTMVPEASPTCLRSGADLWLTNYASNSEGRGAPPRSNLHRKQAESSQRSERIAVGTQVTPRPPHRSLQAYGSHLGW